MLVHTRSRELLMWLLPHSGSWPRAHRHGLTQHVTARALALQDALIAARHGDALQRAASLREADIALDQLRQYLQLAWQSQWMSNGQYQHACRLTAEIGRLLGGWRRKQHPAPD